MYQRSRISRFIRVGACVAIASAGLAGCGNSITNALDQSTDHGPPEGLVLGEATSVGLRPDMLGAASEMPVSAGTDSYNGAQVSFHGTLVEVNADWITLDGNSGERRWIRLESVNWIRQQTPEAPAIPESHDEHGHSGG